MRIDRIAFDERAVVFLGAGATRGASFVEKKKGALLPPLDADFFTQAQRLSKDKPASLVAELIENVVETFGSNFTLTMEGYLTRLEHLANVYEDYKLRGRPGTNKYRAMRDQFRQVLAAVLDESIDGKELCDYHHRLLDVMANQDTIVSFNYDCLIDLTLKKWGKDKWNPRTGYGVPVYARGEKGAGTRHWAYPESDKKEYPKHSITLLKLHGSINWFTVPKDKNFSRLKLRQRWWHQQGDLHFEIAPPEWNKPIRSGIYKRIWQKARAALKEVKALVFIGYSLPETDLPAQALLMVNSQDNPEPLELLVTVNPDQQARRRIRQSLQKRMGSKTRVLSFERFSDFADFLG